MERLDAYTESEHGTYLRWLTEYLRHPALAGKGIGLDDGCMATASMLAHVGARTEIWRRKGAAPVVYGEVGKGDRTLLVYDHYDVQPAEPLDLWVSPPFEPQVRDGHLYARGVADNRGEIVARVAALHAWEHTQGPLPLKVKFIIEGEEEIGSPNLAGYVEEHAEQLKADGILWEGGGWDETDRLAFALGGKGLAFVELHIDGPSHDLHSANAAIVDNPAWRLVQALNTLRLPDGTVSVDGLMDAVRPVTPADDEVLAEIPMDLDALKRSFGIQGFLPGDLPELKRRLIFGPTCNICGIEAGYCGQGPKTVLPALAWCKLDFRLVPDLTPALVKKLLREHLDCRGFRDIDVRLLAAVDPSRSPADSQLAKACLAAAKDAFKQDAYLVPMSPGSGPFHLFAEQLGIPLVSGGSAAYEGSRAHSPNENVRLKDWYGDIRFVGRLLKEFATA